MIIDAHAHLSPTSYGNVELYFKQLKEAGIDQGVVVPGGMLDVRKLTDYIIGKEKPSKEPPNNEYLSDAITENPETLTAFYCVNPHDSDAIEKLEKAFKNGFKGLKLSPMSHHFSLASQTVKGLAELCGHYDYPLYTHTLFSPGASTKRLIALAKEFPETNFILGHMGFGPADTEAMEGALMDNFFLETSQGSHLHIQEVANKVGASKLIFGSEFPLSHPALELQNILLLKLTDDERDLILGQNIKQLLKLY
ncbi:amidohydrolase [Filobacillus milosensis]|uniref:Amidohydrolase n=1 Tax=Filobacillus milosensis TaxID=94137 RepID=A0A4Y8IMR3_9BACI|nr:amidohydrolase family protein [Filobacillus milosensis]TFB21365.1 amidohydrolase [Filobacillus milosensis]